MKVPTTPKTTHQTTFQLFLQILLLFTISLYAANLPELIQSVKTGPQIYYTAEAYSYYTRTGTTLSPQQSQDDAIKSFKALLRFASIGRDRENRR